MKRLIVVFLALLFSATLALADTYVRGYYRKDGTYVEPHYRSDANSSKLDNWSTKGNVNPYTGKKGYVDPYSSGTGYGSNSGYGSSTGSTFGQYQSDSIWSN